MTKNRKTVIITGSAGFIGFHLAQKLLEEDWKVIGIDNLNSYYDKSLKIKRHSILKSNELFTEYIGNIESNNFVKKTVLKTKPDIFVHLAAQAGVRYSLKNPDAYLQSNVFGTFKIIETLKLYKIKHFLVASTSSVYGNNLNVPYNERTSTDFPISFYASTKKAVETFTYTYSHLFKIPTTIFRFFTVYGPWGRPDMALFKFTKAILEDKSIEIFNHGKMKRDFTYIDDLILSIYKLIGEVPAETSNNKKELENKSLYQNTPWRVVNIGNSQPVNLLEFINILEDCLGKKANKIYLSEQKGEVLQTWSSSDFLETLIDYKPNTNIKVGIKNFVDWYIKHYTKEK